MTKDKKPEQEKVSLPSINDSMIEDFKDPVELLELSGIESGHYQWSQAAVDFACCLQGGYSDEVKEEVDATYKQTEREGERERCLVCEEEIKLGEQFTRHSLGMAICYQCQCRHKHVPCNCGPELVVDHSEFGLPMGRNRRCVKCGRTWSVLTESQEI